MHAAKPCGKAGRSRIIPRIIMAQHKHAVPAGGHPDMDYPEHERTYAAFISFSKWAIVAIVVVLVLMAIFLL